MKNQYEVRYASSPREVKKLNTEELRNEFLIQNLLNSGELKTVYSHYDRYITGGAVPANQPLTLDTIDPLKVESVIPSTIITSP